MVPYREFIQNPILRHQTVNGTAIAAVSLHPEIIKTNTRVISLISILSSNNNKP
jgi:hypothetical protein